MKKLPGCWLTSSDMHLSWFMTFTSNTWTSPDLTLLNCIKISDTNKKLLFTREAAAFYSTYFSSTPPPPLLPPLHLTHLHVPLSLLPTLATPVLPLLLLLPLFHLSLCPLHPPLPTSSIASIPPCLSLAPPAPGEASPVCWGCLWCPSGLPTAPWSTLLPHHSSPQMSSLSSSSHLALPPLHPPMPASTSTLASHLWGTHTFSLPYNTPHMRWTCWAQAYIWAHGPGITGTLVALMPSFYLCHTVTQWPPPHTTMSYIMVSQKWLTHFLACTSALHLSVSTLYYSSAHQCSASLHALHSTSSLHALTHL